MNIIKADLIQILTKYTEDHIQNAKHLLKLDLKQLNKKSLEGGWSALECLEHLNRYGDFYIPEIEKRLSQGPSSDKTIFKSGLLGNYFAQSMMPKEKLNRMKTFKSMNPSGSQLDKDVFQKFLVQQEQLIHLLIQSKAKDLTKIKTSISISSLIKLRLGDTFRVVIYHNVRHMQQAFRSIYGNDYALQTDLKQKPA